MSRPVRYQRVEYLFHITHRNNIAGILAARALLCHSRAHRTWSPTDISDQQVNRRRGNKKDSIHERPLHDYVPLYFRARNPMLSRRRSLQSDLVVLYVDDRVMKKSGVVFTDGNSASGATRFFSDFSDLDKIDWDCLDAEYWTGFDDGRRKRCAEVLVPDTVLLSLVKRAVVNNDPLRKAIVQQGWPTSVDVRPEWFFEHADGR